MLLIITKKDLCYRNIFNIANEVESPLMRSVSTHLNNHSNEILLPNLNTCMAGFHCGFADERDMKLRREK